MDARGVARKYDKDSSLFKKLKAVPFDSPAWKDAFPYLQNLPDKDTRLPMGNVVSGNVTAFCEVSVKLAAKAGELAGSEISRNVDLGEGSVGFCDEGSGDLTLAKSSPVFTAAPDFKPIPFGKIGLMKDEFRTVLPVRQLENAPKSWSPH
jgi:hypothetical protein